MSTNYQTKTRRLLTFGSLLVALLLLLGIMTGKVTITTLAQSASSTFTQHVDPAEQAKLQQSLNEVIKANQELLKQQENTDHNSR